MALRGALLWPIMRVASMFVAALSQGMIDAGPGGGIHSPHPFSLSLLAACIAWVDLQRRDEVVFFANLGIGLRTLILVYVAPVFALECLVALLA